jgi:hypothetical protein
MLTPSYGCAQYSEYYMWRKRQAGLLPAAANHVPPPPLPSSFNAAGVPRFCAPLRLER